MNLLLLFKVILQLIRLPTAPRWTLENIRNYIPNNDPVFFHPLSPEMVDYINTKIKPLWKAGQNFPPNTPTSYMQRLAGTLPEPEDLKLPVHEHNLTDVVIPEKYDAREKWGSLCPNLYEIRDQGDCGSCWAFAAVEAMTDRLCIATRGKSSKFRFSAENLLDCCGYFDLCGLGCYGGLPSRAWSYWVKHGIVSGGPYNSHEGCQSYKLPPYHPNETQLSNKNRWRPKCVKKCDDPTMSYKQDLRYGLKAYSIGKKVEQIQAEILKNGPVEAALVLYSDMDVYKSGVYHHVIGHLRGLHAVKILGWGVENGTDFWLCANSWDSDWGDGGFFKIRRGTNECHIESLQVVAGLPSTDGF